MTDRFAFDVGEWVLPHEDSSLIAASKAIHLSGRSGVLMPFEHAVLRADSEFIRSREPMRVTARRLRGDRPWYQVGDLLWPETALIRADPSMISSDNPAHVCGMFCDGQDGMNSLCARTKRVSRVTAPISKPTKPEAPKPEAPPQSAPKQSAPKQSAPPQSAPEAWIARFRVLEIN